LGWWPVETAARSSGNGMFAGRGLGFPMKVVSEPPGQSSVEAERVETVLRELDKILAGRFFRSAGRSRQFLQYVVQNKLEGHGELLKERTIGTEVFGRPADYSTGDDPVVRVQAGEVRRRLEQYYQSTPGGAPVLIGLPVGSYAPTFQWIVDEAPSVAAAPVALAGETLQLQPGKRLAWSWTIAAIAVVFLIAAVTGFVRLQRTLHKQSIMEQFWSPVFTTKQPVLICLAKPVIYLPSRALYERYAQAHPGMFRTEVERYTQPLPLDPAEKISWVDMTANEEFGVALGDAYAAVNLSNLLGKIGKVGQVRIGSNYSFEDLRNSPAIVVGAFNNRWTMHLTENLHFAFVEKSGGDEIQEQISGGRIWRVPVGAVEAETTDYAIVARLMDSKTGQFTVAVAGIMSAGTQAAAEFVSNPKNLEEGLRGAPADWRTKNLEIVLQTAVTDSVAGPPHVVAAYYW
jgi:hypothetical protein